ncbi:hypothetical protein ACIQ7Q_24660 [Streptomyces sp. NPDC096176]|uniref:hypothetical protein n=1 Tax=Streptomyces sp. NPDC096176 TaxID=3366079 RepID=UPI0037F63900
MEASTLPDQLIVRPTAIPHVLIHARKATDDRRALGTELAQRLAHILDKASHGDAELLDDAPAGFRNWLMMRTENPAQAWLEHELTEIILNQGRSGLPREVLEHFPGQSLQALSTPQPTSGSCNACSFAAATGGLLCLCGHDWSCHPGNPAEGEPCSHCPCPTMIHT